TIYVPSAGEYAIEAKVSSATLGRSFHLEFANGVKSSPIRTLGIDAWDLRVTTGGKVRLDAGRQVMRICFDSPPVFFLDWIALYPVGTSRPPDPWFHEKVIAATKLVNADPNNP